MALPIFELLLAAGTNVTTTNTATSVAVAGKPLWLLAAEIVGLVAGTAIVGSLFLRLVTTILTRAGASRAVSNSVRQVLGVLIIAAAAVEVAALTGISSEITTLTISGIGGLAISLALQNTLQNIIAGVFLLNDGIIRLGDDIQYGGPGGVRGEVVKISLRTTWIRTPAGVITIIGNSNLSAGPILNYSGGTRLGKKLQV